MKTILTHKPKSDKVTLSIRVAASTLQRISDLKKRIRDTPDVQSGLDERMEEELLKCVKQAENELKALQRSALAEDVAD